MPAQLGSDKGPSSWFMDGHLLAMFSLAEEREEASSLLSLIRALIPAKEFHKHDLNIS